MERITAKTFIEPLLCTRPYAKYFTFSLSPHSEVVIVISILMDEEVVLKSLGDMPKVTEVMNEGSRLL